MGKPNYEPSPEHRAEVSAMAALGMKPEDIGKALGMRSATALRKHFENELESGLAIANRQAAETLFALAKSGENAAATMFWLKCRMKWNERHAPERVPEPKRDGGNFIVVREQ